MGLSVHVSLSNWYQQLPNEIDLRRMIHQSCLVLASIFHLVLADADIFKCLSRINEGVCALHQRPFLDKAVSGSPRPTNLADIHMLLMPLILYISLAIMIAWLRTLDGISLLEADSESVVSFR